MRVEVLRREVRGEPGLGNAETGPKKKEKHRYS